MMRPRTVLWHVSQRFPAHNLPCDDATMFPEEAEIADMIFDLLQTRMKEPCSAADSMQVADTSNDSNEQFFPPACSSAKQENDPDVYPVIDFVDPLDEEISRTRESIVGPLKNVVDDLDFEGSDADSDYQVQKEEEQLVKRAAFEKIPLSYKKRAVEFWLSGKKKKRTISSVVQRFRRVKNGKQLQRWKRDIESGINRFDKLKDIEVLVWNRFLETTGVSPIHDKDLREWAIEACREVKMQGFTASFRWIGHFKKRYGIASHWIPKADGRPDCTLAIIGKAPPGTIPKGRVEKRTSMDADGVTDKDAEGSSNADITQFLKFDYHVAQDTAEAGGDSEPPVDASEPVESLAKLIGVKRKRKYRPVAHPGKAKKRKAIDDIVWKEFQAAQGKIDIHDKTMKEWGLRANETVQDETFRATPSWIAKFKKRHGIRLVRIEGTKRSTFAVVEDSVGWCEQLNVEEDD